MNLSTPVQSLLNHVEHPTQSTLLIIKLDNPSRKLRKRQPQQQRPRMKSTEQHQQVTIFSYHYVPFCSASPTDGIRALWTRSMPGPHLPRSALVGQASKQRDFGLTSGGHMPLHRSHLSSGTHLQSNRRLLERLLSAESYYRRPISRQRVYGGRTYWLTLNPPLACDPGSRSRVKTPTTCLFLSRNT